MMQVVPSSLQATVAMTAEAWGTGIKMACTYREEPASAEPPQQESIERRTGDVEGHRLALIVVGKDGTKTSAATWTAVEGGTAYPAGSTALRLEQIAAVQVVVAETGDVLLQRSM
jgi:hypothetical protein